MGRVVMRYPWDEETYSRLLTPRPDRPVLSGPGAAVMVGRVVTPDSKVAVGRFLLVNPVSLLGAEAEGAPGRVGVVDAGTVPVYLVGPRPARQGDLLVCRFVNHRWVAERGGSAAPDGYTLGGCPCTAIPGTIFLHVANPQAGGDDSLVFPATLRRQPRPPDLARYTSDPTGYYSDETFTSSDRSYVWRYWFGCSQGQYFLSGLFTLGSPAGFPGRFLVQTWLVGLPGNTCAPFSLANGTTANTTFREMGIRVDGSGPP